MYTSHCSTQFASSTGVLFASAVGVACDSLGAIAVRIEIVSSRQMMSVAAETQRMTLVRKLLVRFSSSAQYSADSALRLTACSSDAHMG